MKSKETISEIKEKIELEQFSQDWLKQLYEDERTGVKKILTQYEKKLEKRQRLKEQFVKMSTIENRLQEQGYDLIAGVDEVGRGPLAGPVVAASVILPKHFKLYGINDSKQLTEEKREHLYESIQKEAIAIGIGMADCDEIDSINIYEATKLAMKRAILDLKLTPNYLLIDAMELPDIPIEQQSIIKGDSKSISIAAASIIAKVTRDRWMKQLHKRYPNYRFDQNMGYGTKDHLKALEQYGPTPHHRKSFQPIQKFMTY